MKRLWDIISHLGVKRDSISLRARGLIMANRLNFALFSVTILLLCVTAYDVQFNGRVDDGYFARLTALLLLCLFNLYLSYRRIFRLMQVLTSIGPVVLVIVLPTLLGYVESSSFFYFDIVILGLSITPKLVYVPKRDNKWYLFSMTLFLVLIIFYDDLMIYFAPGSADTIALVEQFRIYYKIIPVAIFLVLHTALFYMRNINLVFEDRLKEVNHHLSQKIDALENAQERLIQSEKMASIGALSAGIAHEVNNPLNFIKGGADALHEQLKAIDTKSNEQLETCLHIIDEGVSRATLIVQSLSHFSHTTTKMDDPCNIHDILDNCLVILQHKLKNKVEVIKKYHAKPLQRQGNEGRLHQAFLNILANAEQAIEETGQITLETHLRKRQMTVSISDNGQGIPQDLIHRIMDPFITTKPPGKGTGMGLSITYRIIEEHDGTIKVNSVEGKGTTFEIILPFK